MTQILEVAVGLVLVAAILSLVVSASMELIASALNLRGRILVQGLGRMLDQTLKSKDPSPVTDAVLQHPMILSSSSPRAARRSTKPSYIDSVTFATALLDTPVVAVSLTERFLAAKKGIDAQVRAMANKVAGAEALKRAWPNAGGSAAVLVSLLRDDPAGPDALAYLFGPGGVVRARIADLEAARDPAAPILRAQWDASGNNVRDFVQRLETPGLVASFIQGGDAVGLAIRDVKAAHAPLGRTLEQLWIRAGGDFNKFRDEIEDWYDREMQRVSGWYTRTTKWIMVVIGMAIALSFNISMATIARSLWTDPTLRSNVLAEATAIVKERAQTTTTTSPVAGAATGPRNGASPSSVPANCVPPGNTGSEAAGSSAVAGYTCLQGIDLPIGWSSTAWPGDHDPYLILHLLGIAMVGIATSFGAPFWFGLLNNLINLRGGGTPPPPAAQERASTSSEPSSRTPNARDRRR